MPFHPSVFRLQYPCVSAASDKRCGEKVWVLGYS